VWVVFSTLQVMQGVVRLQLSLLVFALLSSAISSIARGRLWLRLHAGARHHQAATRVVAPDIPVVLVECSPQTNFLVEFCCGARSPKSWQLTWFSTAGSFVAARQ
jgi:hypothetical protein